MREVLDLSTTPCTVGITVLLLACSCYWLLNIAGALDLDFLDLDLDSELDGPAEGSRIIDGLLGSILRFMNASDVPLMIISRC